MSSEESTSDSQTPRQEFLDRALEQSPVLGMPRLLAVDDLQKTMSAARRRVADSHAQQMAQLNKVTGNDVKPTPPPSPEEDVISVTGDTTTNHYYGGPPAAGGLKDAVMTKAGAAGKSLVRKALPLALSAGLGAGGLGAALFAWQHWPQPSPAATPADSEYEIRFYDKDGHSISVPRFTHEGPKP